jgi:hypothetical protein
VYTLKSEECEVKKEMRRFRVLGGSKNEGFSLVQGLGLVRVRASPPKQGRSATREVERKSGTHFNVPGYFEHSILPEL